MDDQAFEAFVGKALLTPSDRPLREALVAATLDRAAHMQRRRGRLLAAAAVAGAGLAAWVAQAVGLLAFLARQGERLVAGGTPTGLAPAWQGDPQAWTFVLAAAVVAAASLSLAWSPSGRRE